MLPAAAQEALAKLEEDCRSAIYEAAKDFFNRGGAEQYLYDFLVIAVLNRSMCLIRGFCDLLRSENFAVAASLVRLHMDSALRFSARRFTDDLDSLGSKVLGGESIRDQKTRDGQRMSDKYLLTQLAAGYPWMEDVYRETSGFVHLSSKHIFQAMKATDKKTGAVDLKVSDRDAFVPEWAYLEAIEFFSKLTHVIVGEVRHYTDEKIARCSSEGN